MHVYIHRGMKIYMIACFYCHMGNKQAQLSIYKGCGRRDGSIYGGRAGAMMNNNAGEIYIL